MDLFCQVRHKRLSSMNVENWCDVDAGHFACSLEHKSKIEAVGAPKPDKMACFACGRRTTPKTRSLYGGRYCSDGCGRKGRSEMKTCQNCGDRYLENPRFSDRRCAACAVAWLR